MKKLAKSWFGTDDTKHPGVDLFMNNGDYLLSGNVLLFKDNIAHASSIASFIYKKDVPIPPTQQKQVSFFHFCTLYLRV